MEQSKAWFPDKRKRDGMVFKLVLMEALQDPLIVDGVVRRVTVSQRCSFRSFLQALHVSATICIVQ